MASVDIPLPNGLTLEVRSGTEGAAWTFSYRRSGQRKATEIAAFLVRVRPKEMSKVVRDRLRTLVPDDFLDNEWTEVEQTITRTAEPSSSPTDETYGVRL